MEEYENTSIEINTDISQDGSASSAYMDFESFPDALSDDSASSDNASDNESSKDASAENPDTGASSDSSPEEIPPELTDRLDALIDILTPEESIEEGTLTGTDAESSDSETAYSDSYTIELLESINGTLAMIKSGNVSYHADMLALEEKNAAYLENISSCIETASVVIFVIGFFAALSCGGRFADSLFNRMRGG